MNTNKNLMILNTLKNAKLGRKEKIYSLLLIDVLEETEKLGADLESVFIDHHLLERILLDENQFFVHDFFGRDKNEFPKTFLEACKKLNQRFFEDYFANFEYSFSIRNFYYGRKGFGVRNFIRNLISFIISELDIKIKAQPIFASVCNDQWSNENVVCISFFVGKLNGRNIYNQKFESPRRLSESELTGLQTEAERIAKTDPTLLFETDVMETFIQQMVG